MNILRTIFKIFFQVILGLFVFYLFCAWILIPFVSPGVIESQGKKFLKHPVHVKGLTFNPFLWRLNIKALEITNDRQEKLISFERLSVDISFLSLLKKQYRVESFVLDGLTVNAILLKDGRINLLELVPAQETKPAEAKKPEPMPVVILDLISITNGAINFTDQTIQPVFNTSLHTINITVTGLSTKSDAEAKISFNAKLGDKGVVTSESVVKLFVDPLFLETSFTLNNYALDVLTPYIGKYTGRSLKDGQFDLRMDYRINNNQLTASHKLLIQRFTFGDKVESKDALGLPFGLAIALLEDSQGKINVALPVKGNIKDPKFEYFHLIGQVARNFLLKVVTKPFTFLSSVVAGSEEGTDELGYVKFIPGQSDLSQEDNQKLATLTKGLKERPKLRLEINGSFDPDLDWRAIKTKVFQEEYTQLRKDSTRKEAWVYQDLYQRRFGIRDLWALTKKYKASMGVYDEAKLIDEIKRQLIENAPADKVALDVLAQTRAKTVYDALISSGMDEKHLTIGMVKPTSSTMGAVPLEFTLTVLGDN